MMNLYNVTVDEWQALERIKAEAYERGYVKGYEEAFDQGRAVGFSAGFAAALEQPAAKIEAAYEQGRKAGTIMAEMSFSYNKAEKA